MDGFSFQDWTKQENEDAEGVVTTFRVAPGEVPDVKSITKKMAIVAWQPGPNRMLVVPKKVLETLNHLFILSDCRVSFWVFLPLRCVFHK